jgi:hypothetical protein
MASRVAQVVGQKYNKKNFLLMHAIGPNVSGVIGTASAAGMFIAMFAQENLPLYVYAPDSGTEGVHFRLVGWGDVFITLGVRFVAVFIILGLLQVMMQLSSLILRRFAKE